MKESHKKKKRKRTHSRDEKGGATKRERKRVEDVIILFGYNCGIYLIREIDQSTLLDFDRVNILPYIFPLLIQELRNED